VYGEKVRVEVDISCKSMCCCVLLCVAVCCSVLQCVAVCCSVLQCVAVRVEIDISCDSMHMFISLDGCISSFSIYIFCGAP